MNDRKNFENENETIVYHTANELGEKNREKKEEIIYARPTKKRKTKK